MHSCQFVFIEYIHKHPTLTLTFNLTNPLKYPPHCSMTGFFELPFLHAGSWSVESQCIRDLNRAVGKHLGISALGEFGSCEDWSSTSEELSIDSLPKDCEPLVRIQKIRRPEHAPRTLSIHLSVGEKLRSIISDFQQSVDQTLHSLRNMNGLTASDHDQKNSIDASSMPWPDLARHPAFQIRGKAMDHISLAYINKHVHINNALGSEMLASPTDNGVSTTALKLEALHQLADQMITLPSSKVEEKREDRRSRWRIVFYEVVHKSDTLERSHEFRQLCEWNIPPSLE
jgi:hypothetical protein